MITYKTQTWGYKIISNRLLNFYHVDLKKIESAKLYKYLPQVQRITAQKDGSITITFSSGYSLPFGLQKIISLFNRQSLEPLECPDYHYRVPVSIKSVLKGWFLSFEASLLLLLLHDEQVASLVETQWELIDSPVGGLYAAPYTLFLYADHPKVIQPITADSYDTRDIIEQKTALFIRSLIGRILDAQPGFEGQALVSYVQEKLGLSKDEVSEKINVLCKDIQVPLHAPFFLEKEERVSRNLSLRFAL